MFRLSIAFILSLLAVDAAAAASDWKVSRLQGQASQFYSGDWLPLHPGDVVSDSAILSTGKDGVLELGRNDEKVTIGAGSQVQLFDRGDPRFTEIRQNVGSVGVEAHVEKSPHFSVRTPFLAAVVKGTVFAVKTTDHQSLVAVQRGRVKTIDAAGKSNIDVKVGQSGGSDDGLLYIGPPLPAASEVSAESAIEAADAALYKVGLSTDWPSTHRPTVWTRLAGIAGTDASGPSAIEWSVFGVGALLAAIVSGFALEYILAQVGFGMVLNGLLAVGGAIIGFGLRYLLFTDDDWETYEPIVTITPVVVMMLLTIGVAVLAKWRVVR